MNIVYKKSNTAKRLRITISRDGQCIVTIPRRMDEVIAQKFVNEKSDWIQKQINRVALLPPPTVYSKKEIVALKKQTRTLVTERLAYFNQFYGHTYFKISIRRQKTRWGSCSKTGNLNFNYKIALLPSHLADYIIVHELCHLKEMNHSKRFWALVARAIPDPTQRKKELRAYRLH